MKKILGNPKIIIGISIVLAVVLGFIVTSAHTKTLNERFANLDVSSETSSTTSELSKDLILAFPVGGRIQSVSVKAGQVVKKGDVLASLDSENASGAISQAQGAYMAAETAYNKLVAGASSQDIDVAKVALTNAQNAYNTTVSQQNTLVANALSALMSSGLVAESTTNGDSTDAPTISGTYTGAEGTYTVTTFGTGSGIYYSVSGLDGGGSYPASTVPSPLGTRGLYISFPSDTSVNASWTISIPNKKSSNYLTLSNAYKAAQETQTQTVSNAKGAVDAAQANLDQKVAGARSEDLDIARAQVESTKGALEIAQAAFNNTLIVAPADGTIESVSIVAGQIATANTPAIEFLSQ